MQEIHISKLSQYLNAIERLKTYYPNGPIFGNPSSLSFLYRGHSRNSYELLPSLYRKQRDLADPETELYVDNYKYITNSRETDLLNEFMHEASAILSIPPEKLSNWAEYAQHYGVPTRFLDWSKNPLVALYFTCRDYQNEDGSVWMLHANNYDCLCGAINENILGKPRRQIVDELISGQVKYVYPVLYTPYYVDTRMSSQSSYFMAWGENRSSFETIFSEEKYYMRLPEEDSKSKKYGKHEQEAFLFRFLIYADRKPHLLRELDTVGINEKTLFPGLDGIGRYVEQKYRFNYNELLTGMV